MDVAWQTPSYWKTSILRPAARQICATHPDSNCALVQDDGQLSSLASNPALMRAIWLLARQSDTLQTWPKNHGIDWAGLPAASALRLPATVWGRTAPSHFASSRCAALPRHGQEPIQHRSSAVSHADSDRTPGCCVRSR